MVVEDEEDALVHVKISFIPHIPDQTYDSRGLPFNKDRCQTLTLFIAIKEVEDFVNEIKLQLELAHH